MKQVMNVRTIENKLYNEAAIIVANDRVYWKYYNDECVEVLRESPLEWLETPWNASRMTIAVYSNTCSKGLGIVIAGDENIVTIHGHKKIRVTVTGMGNFISSEDENALLGVVEEYNYHNYVHGVCLKEICGVLYDVNTSKYQLRISSTHQCQIIVGDGYRAGIWDCWNEEIIDQGDCQAHYLDDWFPITEKFSKKSKKKFLIA